MWHITCSMSVCLRACVLPTAHDRSGDLQRMNTYWEKLLRSVDKAKQETLIGGRRIASASACVRVAFSREVSRHHSFLFRPT